MVVRTPENPPEPAPHEPALTEEFVRTDAFVPPPGSVYIYALSGEERCEHVETIKRAAQGVRWVTITPESSWTAVIERDGISFPIQLRSERQLSDFWRTYRGVPCYLDFTGMSHNVWAPLVRIALSVKTDLRVVYVEPTEYRYSATPMEGQIFDLSASTEGISPLPGFAVLDERVREFVFIPLLGFEGVRLKHLLSTLEPPEDRIAPIIGAPGFRPEYIFHAYQGNKTSLLENNAWQYVRYARANCPFSALSVLEKISAQYPGMYIKAAPIGTKPHALGAVLFKLRHWETVELVYDHPIRKANRTQGRDRLFVYYLKAFAAV